VEVQIKVRRAPADPARLGAPENQSFSACDIVTPLPVMVVLSTLLIRQGRPPRAGFWILGPEAFPNWPRIRVAELSCCGSERPQGPTY